LPPRADRKALSAPRRRGLRPLRQGYLRGHEDARREGHRLQPAQEPALPDGESLRLMAVPENIVSAYAAYLQGMEEAAGNKKSLSGLFGIGRDVTRERCQEDFISALTAAVEDFAASEPDPQETAEAVKYIFAQ